MEQAANRDTGIWFVPMKYDSYYIAFIFDILYDEVKARGRGAYASIQCIPNQ